MCQILSADGTHVLSIYCDIYVKRIKLLLILTHLCTMLDKMAFLSVQILPTDDTNISLLYRATYVNRKELFSHWYLCTLLD